VTTEAKAIVLMNEAIIATSTILRMLADDHAETRHALGIALSRIYKLEEELAALKPKRKTKAVVG
jgi:hypothetical protein